MEQKIFQIIHSIQQKREEVVIKELNHNMSLRKDLKFDSFDLAVLTVTIEDAFGVDIFENGIVDKISEIFDAVRIGSEMA